MRLSGLAIWRGVVGVYKSDDLTFASSIAYYALLSLFPFFLLVFSILGSVTANPADRAAILADVKGITARVSQQTERVDHAITGTIDRVDHTADRVRAGVYEKIYQVAGLVRGVRAVIMSLLHKESHA